MSKIQIYGLVINLEDDEYIKIRPMLSEKVLEVIVAKNKVDLIQKAINLRFTEEELYFSGRDIFQQMRIDDMLDELRKCL